MEDDDTLKAQREAQVARLKGEPTHTAAVQTAPTNPKAIVSAPASNVAVIVL